MGIGYICKPGAGFAISVWDGVVTWDDWQNNIQRLFNDPDYRSIQSHIVDLRFSSLDSSLTIQKFQQITAFMAARRGNVSIRKLALVAGEEWAKLKEFEKLVKAASIDAIVFNDLVTACKWLGIDAVDVEREIQRIRLKLRQDALKP